MPDPIDVAIVGAGPFGLSVAAHLHTLSTRTFGREMETWRTRMPYYMTLRSAWHETSLSAPGGAGTIDAWVQATGEERREPIPLELFLRYSAWFAERFVADRDSHDVAHVEPAGAGFRVTTGAGAETDARQIVIAVGVTPFATVPPELNGLYGSDATLATGSPNEPERFAGRKVLVVGGGQAGLETAGLTAQAGAEVELVTRSSVRWFADREPHAPRGALGRRLYRLAYPAVGYGPPPLNRLVLHPDLFARLPVSARRALTRRLLRSGGSPSLRPLVEGKVRLTENCTLTRADRQDEQISVHLSDGSVRKVDHVLIASGYRFDLDRLGFLSAAVRSRIAVEGGWPVLDRYFRSTDPRIFFVGYPAEGRFGPISRFVLGADFTANRIGGLLSA